MIEVHHELAGPGDAPVVVLSNSLATTLAMWDGNVPALVGRYRVVRYDMRGHGRSPVPDGPSTLADLGGDLLALLDRLGIERAHLVGVSIGGMVSLWTAANAPERVASLVPCFTSAQLGPPELWQERAALALAEGTEALADATMARWFTAGFAAASRRSSRPSGPAWRGRARPATRASVTRSRRWRWWTSCRGSRRRRSSSRARTTRRRRPSTAG